MGVRGLPTEFATRSSQLVTPETRAKVANTPGVITLTQFEDQSDRHGRLRTADEQSQIGGPVIRRIPGASMVSIVYSLVGGEGVAPVVASRGCNASSTALFSGFRIEGASEKFINMSVLAR